MEMNYFKEYSPSLDRDMEWKVYGHAGQPIIFIPCQDGRFYDFENFKMIDRFWPWIESGEIIVFAIDTMDRETYSAVWEPYWRIRRHEQWISYITDEMVPFIRDYISGKNGAGHFLAPIPFGCSLGATHAANLYFRRPDLFGGLLALSGIYSSDYGFGNYMDELVYYNSPVNYLSNMPADHPYMQLYRDKPAVICCGRGPWEQTDTTFRLKSILEEKGIPVWVDIWGYDVSHDWYWWYRQVEYFIPFLLKQKTI